MPLAPCPDCGNECSTLAPACPKCGRPLWGEEPQRSEVELCEDEEAFLAHLPEDLRERERSAIIQSKQMATQKERLASIPVSSRVVSGVNTPSAQTERATQIGCLIVAVIFIVFALFCCSSGRKSSTYDSTYTPSSGGGGSTSAPSSSGSTAPSSSNGASREDETTRRRYAECVRQRNAAGLDTSPCAEWSKER
jgi:hypothetical protein